MLERLNDPRAYELSAQAVALLEPLPPGRELVDALLYVASDATLGGDPEEGLALVERALAIAVEAGLPQDWALGHRGMARTILGDPAGLKDYRDAIDALTRAGQGRRAAVEYNNLGCDLRNYEGPRAALEALSEGLRFATARGLEGPALMIRVSALPAMLSDGDLSANLAAAAELAVLAEDSGEERVLIEIRAIQALALTYTGRADETRNFLDLILDAARRSGSPNRIVYGFGCAAAAHATLGDHGTAAGLLTNIETTPNLDEAGELATYLPVLVRTAITVGAPDLGVRLSGHLTPRHPYAEHALAAVRAALDEAHGEADRAAAGYADAASRWENFGDLPEQGFALLGQGRCLLQLNRPAQAAEALPAARDIFTRCGMLPARTETDTLLAQATSLTS